MIAENVFSIPLPQLKKFSRGERIANARPKLNATIDAVNQLRAVALPKQIIRQSVPEIPTASGVEFAWFRIVTVREEDILCHTWDGETEGELNVYVAKPWDLRRSTYHGVHRRTFTYTSLGSEARKSVRDGDGNIEYQVIVPSYSSPTLPVGSYPGDIILAARGLPTLSGREWLDMNIAGRAWARRYYQ